MAKSGRWSEAVELLEQARNDGLEPNKYCFTAAVSSCAKGRNGKLALSLLEEMRASGLRPDHVTYGSAVNAMAKTGQWVSGRCVAEHADPSMKASNSHAVSIAKPAVAYPSGQDVTRRTASGPTLETSSQHLHPRYCCCVPACLGQWQRALNLLHQMAEEGLQPNVVCYGAAVDACAKGGQWERAVALLEEMRAAGVEPDR